MKLAGLNKLFSAALWRLWSALTAKFVKWGNSSVDRAEKRDRDAR
jgi:hypothetical protein